MSLKEFIKNLGNYNGVMAELRDKDGCFLCITNTKSVGITPYLDKNILKWCVHEGDCYDCYDDSLIVLLNIYLDVDGKKWLETVNEKTR